MIEVIMVSIVVGYVVGKMMKNDRIRFNISNGCWMSKEEWDKV